LGGRKKKTKARNALDGLGRDVRSKSILGVRERREDERHGCSWSEVLGSIDRV
jgi:hypothetical protein